MQQLTDVRQVVANSYVLFKDLHEKRFGPLTNPPAVVVDSILPLQLVIPPTFRAEVQKYHISSRAREVLSDALDKLMDSYIQQFDDSCRKLSQAATTQLQPQLPKIVEKFREGLQTHFESIGLRKIMSAVIEYAEKRPSCSTPQPPVRPKPFNKEYTPLLNEYFKFDAYPTTSDQKIIAERSGMTQGQIFNWFQNHRRIAHQNGTQLKKRPTGSYVPPNVQVPFLSTVSTSFSHPQQLPPGLYPNGEPPQMETEIQTAEEAEKEKQRMLDIFNAKPSASVTPSSTSSASSSPVPVVSTTKKGKGRIGTGTGFTADDPIEIPSSNSDSMMITYSPGEAVGVVQHVDAVDRVARNARSYACASAIARVEQRDVIMGENEEGEEDLGEEKVKFLSIITPRYPPSFAPSSASSSSVLAFPAPLNPLDFLPSSSDSDDSDLEDSAHLAPLVRPTPEPLFRSGKERGDTLPPLPSPSSLWFRLAPETSYMVPPPPSGTNSSSAKSKSKKKEKEKEKTPEELAQAAALKEAEKVMMQRLMCWSLEDPVESGSGSVTLASSSSALASRAKSRAKKILRALGFGSDAATCAITVKPSRAPFWAFVPSRGSSTASSSSSGTSVESMTGVVSTPRRTRENSPSAAASSATKTNGTGKKQKPAALGPKRKPRGSPAPSASTSSSPKRSQPKSKSVSSTPEPESSRSNSPSSSSSSDQQGQSLQRHGSSSSLSSMTSSSSSSVEPETDSRPRTPVDGVDIPRMPVSKFGFPLPGFTTVSSSASHPSSSSFASFEAYGVDIGMPVKQAAPPSQTYAQPQSQAFTSMQQVPDYAFGNPYINATMSESGAINPMHIMHSHSQSHSGMDMDMSIEELNALLGIGSSTPTAPASIHAPSHSQHGYVVPQPQMQQGHNPYNNMVSSMSMGMGGYQGFNMTS